MINRILLIVTICLSFILLFMSSRNTTFFNSKPNITIKNTNTNKIEKMSLEEYIIGVVAAEMPASFNEEALKAQAVASRTYAVYKMQNSKTEYDVVTDVSNQSFITKEDMKDKWKDEFDKYYKKIKDAVNKTKNEIMMYEDKVIEAYYFAMSNGFTEDVSLVFNEDREYLKSVKSVYENNDLKNFEVVKKFSKEEVCSKLNIVCDNISFKNIKRSNTGRVNSLNINETVYKGTDFRKKLGLRSTDFYIEEKDGYFYITTKGYGHGVGMSQYGANGMAKEGYTYDEILKYFYKNIEIKSI